MGSDLTGCLLCTGPHPCHLPFSFNFFLSATRGFKLMECDSCREEAKKKKKTYSATPGMIITFINVDRLGHKGSLHWSLVVSHFQGIEQLKKEERRWDKKTKWMNMRAVFGHPFSILWFSPFSTPDHGKAETYQYVVWELSAGNKAGSQSGKLLPGPESDAELTLPC